MTKIPFFFSFLLQLSPGASGKSDNTAGRESKDNCLLSRNEMELDTSVVNQSTMCQLLCWRSSPERR